MTVRVQGQPSAGSPSSPSSPPPGTVHVQLGPVERWVVGICAVTLFSIAGYTAKTFADRLDRQTDQMAELSKQQAVANTQLTALTVSMADVRGLSQRVTELAGQVTRNTDDIRDIRANERAAR